MRPRGEIREALAKAAKALAVGATWRELAAKAQVSFAQARLAIKNMVKSGELVAAGERREAHAKRPMALYVYFTEAAQSASCAIQAIMGSWVVSA